MKTIQENSQQIISITGILLGTLMGWILNNISRRGRMQFYTVAWENKFFGELMNGSETIASRFEESKNYTYEVFLDVFNSSGTNKIIRDVRIVFFAGKELMQSHKPYDKSTAVFSNYRTKYEEFQYINIPPKELRRLEFVGFINETEIKRLKDIDTVRMLYTNEKGKKKRVSISSKCFSEYFKSDNA
jgi:hypothetical protein